MILYSEQDTGDRIKKTSGDRIQRTRYRGHRTEDKIYGNKIQRTRYRGSKYSGRSAKRMRMQEGSVKGQNMWREESGARARP